MSAATHPRIGVTALGPSTVADVSETRSHLTCLEPGAVVADLSEISSYRADKHFVKSIVWQAEEILDVAMAADAAAGDLAILIDRQGGIRMLDPTGWSLPALSADFGASAVYRVQRRGRTVRVEGWRGGERCLIQRNLGPRRVSDLTGMSLPHAEQRVLTA